MNSAPIPSTPQKLYEKALRLVSGQAGEEGVARMPTYAASASWLSCARARNWRSRSLKGYCSTLTTSRYLPHLALHYTKRIVEPPIAHL
jgi:hypothetical protein